MRGKNKGQPIRQNKALQTFLGYLIDFRVSYPKVIKESKLEPL